jgi:hypothetical protein
MRIIKIGRKKYAIGLWWQVFSHSASGHRARLEEVRNQAASIPDSGYDRVVFRGDQYGLGRSEDVKTHKVPSLACSLITDSETSWIGLFRVDDQNDIWWVCAVTQRLIAGDGDYCASESDAKRRFNDLKALTEWSNEIVCETETESISFFQTQLSSGEKVIPLSGEPIGPKIAAVMTIALILVGSWQGWRMYLAHVEAEQAAKIAQQAALNQKASINPDHVFKRTWLSSPLPTVFSSICLEELNQLPLFSRGWKLTIATCDNTGMTQSWTHLAGASFADLPAGAVLDKTAPTTARSRVTFPISSGRSPQPLVNQDSVMTSLYEITRFSGALLRGPDWKDPEIRTVDQGVGLPSLKVFSPWVEGSWTLSELPEAAFRSEQFFEALDRIPGLVLMRINRTDTNTMEGVVYALQ